MQRRIYIFCLALSMICLVSSSYAQKDKSEFSLSYGRFSVYNFYVGSPYSASSGTGMLSYKYYVSNKVTLGMTAGYENISSYGSYLSFVPEFTYAYYDNKHDRVRVRLYSGASFGMTVFDDFFPYSNTYSLHHDESGARPTGQATVFGMRVGRKFAGFGELGFGYKGLFNFGLSYRFRTKAMPKEEK